jgi:peroxiredoxin
MWGKKRLPMLEAGAQAPPFELKAVDGGSQSLDGILAKGPALLAFFKVGCPTCQLTLPFLDRLAQTPGVQVIGISQDDAKATASFNQRFGVHFPILIDESSNGYPASNAFGISSVPSLFLIDSQRAVTKAFTGFSKRDIEDLGARVGVQPFHPGEQVPEWKAG